MNTMILPVTCHTDNVGKQSTFVAIQGYKENGIIYIPQALERGAKTIIVATNTKLPNDIYNAIIQANVQLHYVENPRQALAQLSAQAWQFPAKKLRIIGITGTKGKTSTVFILHHILHTAGYKTALMGTVKNSINGVDFPAPLTTPQPDYIHWFFQQCVLAHVDFVIMEVAAQALSLYRVDGIEFSGAIFTNFSQEHGEFYPNLNDYFQAKCKLFDQLKPSAPALINDDDIWCKNLLNNNNHFIGFSLKQNTMQFHCPALIGHFNQYNLWAATTMALKLGVDCQEIQKALNNFPGIPGRMERYFLPNGAQGIIDYAHNPSSFEAILSTLRTLTEQLIVVFGCGGNRDAAKRPIMGAIASNYADLCIITSDNPRNEQAEVIAQEILEGIAMQKRSKIFCELDREQAIKLAYQKSNSEAIIALLGKGPDEYQIIGATKHYFSERKILLSLK